MIRLGVFVLAWITGLTALGYLGLRGFVELCRRYGTDPIPTPTFKYTHTGHDQTKAEAVYQREQQQARLARKKAAATKAASGKRPLPFTRSA